LYPLFVYFLLPQELNRTWVFVALTLTHKYRKPHTQKKRKCIKAISFYLYLTYTNIHTYLQDDAT